MVIKHSPRMFNQPDNNLLLSTLIQVTHHEQLRLNMKCVKMSDFTIARV